MAAASTDLREMLAYYAGFDEAARLTKGDGLLEFARMQELREERRNRGNRSGGHGGEHRGMGKRGRGRHH